MPEESQQEQANKERQVPAWGQVLLGVYLVALLGLAFYLIIALWPGAADYPVKIFNCTIPNNTELGWLLLVFSAGTLGGLVHAIRSFYDFAGAQELYKNWLPMYLLLPFLGGALSLVFYIVVRGGLLVGQVGNTDITKNMSPIGFTAVGVLVGMFSEQAITKLKDVADTLFKKPDKAADPNTERPDPNNGDDDPA